MNKKLLKEVLWLISQRREGKNIEKWNAKIENWIRAHPNVSEIVLREMREATKEVV